MAKRDRPKSGPRSTMTRSGVGRSGRIGVVRQGPWVGALWVVAAATGFVILSDDARLLRLGLVTALWVALFGAFAAARLRQRVVEQHDRAAEQQRAYERALEAEVAARQDFEERVETATRREIAAEYDAELHALRTELNQLRSRLRGIAPGEPVRTPWDGRSAPGVGTGQRPGGADPPQIPSGQRTAMSGAEPPRGYARPPALESAQGAAAAPGHEPVVAPDAASAAPADDRGDPDSTARSAPDSHAPDSDAPDADSDGSAHTTGTSVTELLAAYGDSGTRPGRRRRRR